MNLLNNFKNINNLFSIIFSLLFIFGVYKIVNDFNSIIDNISKISFSILFVSTLVYFTSVILRYFRWKIIYKELFEQYKFNMLNETIIGYMANNIFPFRLGELYRVNRIVNSEQNKFTRVLSTIFTERLFDVISLVIIMIFAFPFIKEFDFKLFQLKNSFIIILLFLLLLIFVFLLSRLNFFRILLSKILVFFQDILSFFYECKSINKYIKVFIFSLLIWIVESIVYFIIADYFITNISRIELFFMILVVCSITNLSGVIPSLPGNLGNFEFFGTLAFIAMNVSSDIGATIIIIVHLVLFIPISILGFIILATKKLPTKKT